MKMEIELRPFMVPNFVTQVMPARPRHEGVKESPSFALRDLSPEVLAGLCDQFRRDVFAKAMKLDPAFEQPQEPRHD